MLKPFSNQRNIQIKKDQSCKKKKYFRISSLKKGLKKVTSADKDYSCLEKNKENNGDQENLLKGN